MVRTVMSFFGIINVREAHCYDDCLFSTPINRNCNVLPLSLEDLLNYTTLMLKFCTNKPIWASLLRQDFFGGGGRGHFTPKKGVTLYLQATDFDKKKSSASSIRIVRYCKYDMYFNSLTAKSVLAGEKLVATY